MNDFRATPIRIDSGLALIAVESLERGHSKSESGWWLQGALKPVAVIVCNTDGADVLAIDEGVADIDVLIDEVPGLEPMIASLTNTTKIR